MIYIYDIWINLNDEYYEFYEWDEKDIIDHIRKVPLIRVSSILLNKIKNKSALVSKTFLDSIYSKCEIFNNSEVETIEYACVLSDGSQAIVATFNNLGKILELSSISVSEELEILEICTTLVERNIKYSELKKEVDKRYLTRNESKIIKSIVSELEKLKDDNNIIEYLCYEWFNTTDNVSYEKLINDVKKEFNNKHIEFMEILKLVV